MARFASEGETEPLMRLERPSISSSQATAHIINSCFNELLSHKKLDPKDISNLSVSRRESTQSDFQESFVDKLTKITEESKQSLEALAGVERHLVQARAKAIAEDERNLEDLSSACPSFQSIGVPQCPSQFHKHLSEELLARHELLIPSQWLLKPRSLTRGGNKRAFYPMKATTRKHVHLPPVPGNTLDRIKATQKILKLSWQESLSAAEREVEKKTLSELDRKTAYLKNPKYFNELNNTSIFAPLKEKRKHTSNVELRELDPFLISPKEVVFSVYHPGDVLRCVVEFKNVSGASRHLRLLPLKSDYFSVASGSFPNVDGLVAPGMQCTFVVTFTPDSLANYQEEMRVAVSSGEYLVVPLTGMRLSPELSLPDVLNCGGCLAGDSKLWSTQITNYGGEGKFKLMLSGENDGGNTDTEADSLSVGPFVVSPREFSILGSGGVVELQVKFTPPEIGHFSEELCMACDNGQVLSYTITGTAEKICIGCTDIRPSTTAEKGSFSTAHDATKVAEVSVSPSAGERAKVIETPCVQLESVNPNNSSFMTVVIHNFSNVKLPFKWEYYRPLTEPLFNTGSEDQERESMFHIEEGDSLYQDQKRDSLYHTEGDENSQYYTEEDNEKDPLCHSVGTQERGSLCHTEGDRFVDHTEEDHSSYISNPVPSKQSPFALFPSAGVILGHQAATFVVRFHPVELGSFVDMGYLILTSPVHLESLDSSAAGSGWVQLSDSRVCISCLQLQGACQPYIIEMSPPALIIPGQIPISTPLTRLLKITNSSLADICYHWSSVEGSNVTVSVEPVQGKITGGGSCNCLVKILGHQEGPFAFTLECSVDGSQQLFPFFVSGEIQGPVVSLDCGELNFGLIPYGKSASLKLCIRNRSECFVDFCLKQLVQSKEDGFMDHQCLSFLPSEGTLSSRASIETTVECTPECSGRLRSLVQLFVNDKLSKCVAVTAEVQRPGLCLDACKVHMEDVYVGIPHTHTVVLKNKSLIPAWFTWSSQVYGQDRKYCRIDMRDRSLRVGPKDELSLPTHITWTTEGSFDDVFLKCDVVNMESPLVISFSAYVRGLSVVYQLLSNSSDEIDENIELPLPAVDDNEYFLDFGADNKLGEPVSRTIKITNTSAISTSLQTLISHFPAAETSSNPPPRVEVLGNKSANVIVKAGSKTVEQETEEYISSLLSHNHGVCFVVEPSSAELPAFGSVTLRVTAYSDMWGQYQDQMVCMVQGLESTSIAIQIGFVGCPIEFQPTATRAKTLVRFGTHPIGARQVRRCIQMKNSSPVALRVDWKVFSILLDDDKLIDFVAIFGNDFPVAKNILASRSYSEDDSVVLSTKEVRASVCSVVPGSVGSAGTEGSGRRSGREVTSTRRDEDSVSGSSVGEVVELLSPDQENPIHVLLKPHEGQEITSTPYTVIPKQMVIPPHGKATVDVVFTPTADAIRDLGRKPNGYVLGYLSIDKQDPPCVSRMTGYNVAPLRMDLMAGIEQPRLVLEYDEDNSLHFECPASLLLRDMEIKPEASQVYKYTLFNPTSSIQYFDFCTTSSYFFVTDIQNTSTLRRPQDSSANWIGIQPKASIKFSIKFSFTPDDIAVDNVSNSSETYFEGMLQIKFSVGTVQEFPLSATIKLPFLTATGGDCDMGTVHLGSSSSSTFIINNVSLSETIWVLQLSKELLDVVEVSPQSGKLMSHLYRGNVSKQTIRVTFTPKYEALYSGVLAIQELLSGQVLSLGISGIGSADEQHTN